MIEHKVKEYIKEHSMLKDGDKVIVTLSGGADSVTLLLVLHALGYECHAAHCNFHLRGEESMRDEMFATSLCKELGVPFHKTDFDTEAYSKEKGISIEMGARELRYDYFRKLKDEVGTNAIAVGHHRDDNIETLFLNLVRGTGIQGLCGIQPVNGDIIRPLLCISREDILQYLDGKGQSYVTDSTNLEDVYSRNKIRLNILPELQQINQGAMENIKATINNLNEVRKIYEATIKADIERCKATKADTYIIKELLSCLSPTSVLHEIIYPLGFNKSQEDDILNAARQDETGKMFYSASHIITIDRGKIVISPKGESETFPVSLDDFKLIERKLMRKEDCGIIKDKSYAYIDADKVKGELIVRRCKTGDSFVPFGMKGRKLLSDYMTDCKFNRLQKMSQLVLCDSDGEIVWVIGERASDKYRIDDNTRNVIQLHSTKP
ncbi:MAG: tRNA lysidine(34) synthetase TilS [Bacteroidaceae bacterium]|nr:tRNA lysidine(34) synthetase TilS [Bacteroidaceae bacterium]